MDSKPTFPWSDQVKFNTTSDAKFAQLFLTYKLSYGALNTVLELLFDPTFVVDELTFKKPEDLYKHIANVRPFTIEQHLSNTISTTQMVIDLKPRVPCLVVQLVVDHLYDELRAMPLQIRTLDFFDNRHSFAIVKEIFLENTAALKSLSLVQRSWTPMVQRALRRHAKINNDNILLYLVNPSCDEWVRQLHFTHDEHRNPNELIEHDDRSHFSSLMSRVSNLRRLRLTVGGSKGKLTFQSYFGAMVKLTSLRVLQLECHYEKDTTPDLDSFLATLPSLTSLEELKIFNWTYNIRQSMPPASHALNTSPPASLKTIHFGYSGYLREPFLPPEISRWLLEPRGAYEITAICVLLDDNVDFDKCITPVISYALPSVEYLKIWGKMGNFEQLSQMGRLLAHCSDSRLRRLSYAPTGGRPYGDHNDLSVRLPRGLEELEIHHVESEIVLEVILKLLDQNIISLLRLSVLRCSLAIRGRWPSRLTWGDRAIETKLESFCQNHGIRLETMMHHH